MMLWICLAYLSFAVGSVIVYAKGVENKPWLGQGIRFGILMWLILAVPSFLSLMQCSRFPRSLWSSRFYLKVSTRSCSGLSLPRSIARKC